MISVALPINKRLSAWERFGILHQLAEKPIYLVLIIGSVVLVSVGVGVGISFVMSSPTPSPTNVVAPGPLDVQPAHLSSASSIVHQSQTMVGKVLSFASRNKPAFIISVMSFVALITIAIVLAIVLTPSNPQPHDDVVDPEEPKDIVIPEEGTDYSWWLLGGGLAVVVVVVVGSLAWAGKSGRLNCGPGDQFAGISAPKQQLLEKVRGIFTDLPQNAGHVVPQPATPSSLISTLAYKDQTTNVLSVPVHLQKGLYLLAKNQNWDLPPLFLICTDDSNQMKVTPFDRAFLDVIDDVDAANLTKKLQTSFILDLAGTKYKLAEFLTRKWDYWEKAFMAKPLVEPAVGNKDDGHSWHIIFGEDVRYLKFADDDRSAMYRYVRERMNVQGKFLLARGNSVKLGFTVIPLPSFSVIKKNQIEEIGRQFHDSNYLLNFIPTIEG